MMRPPGNCSPRRPHPSVGFLDPRGATAAPRTPTPEGAADAKALGRDLCK